MRTIDSEKLIKAVLELPNCPNGFSSVYDKEFIIGLIDEQPTIDPVKHGKWERDSEGESYCSLCGKYTNDLQDEPFEWNGAIGWALKLPNYCSRCGARMDL